MNTNYAHYWPAGKLDDLQHRKLRHALIVVRATLTDKELARPGLDSRVTIGQVIQDALERDICAG